MKVPRDFPRIVSAAIFDFDETMVDLEGQHTSASAALCHHMGSNYNEMPEAFRHSSGRRVIDDVRELRESFGWSDSIESLMERRQEHFERACRESVIELMAGVERAVHALYGLGITLAIASSSVRTSIETILSRLGVRDMFSVITEGAEVREGKPNPEAYLVTAAKLEVPAGVCVVFEDSEVGVQAARRAGMFCIAVRNPRAKIHQDLPAANVVLDSFVDLDLEWFKSSLRPGSTQQRRV